MPHVDTCYRNLFSRRYRLSRKPHNGNSFLYTTLYKSCLHRDRVDYTQHEARKYWHVVKYINIRIYELIQRVMVTTTLYVKIISQKINKQDYKKFNDKIIPQIWLYESVIVRIQKSTNKKDHCRNWLGCVPIRVPTYW